MFNRWLNISPDKSALIIGPRRSGKTTLLKNTFPGYKYVTLDNLDYLDWAETDPKGMITSLGEKAIIDEIQRYPRLTIAAKYAIDNQNAIFFMTGSSSIGLLDLSAETLAGRINLYHLPTVCFGENIGSATHSILEDNINQPELKQGQRKIEEALKYGHFPEILEEKVTEKKHKLLLNYRDTYFIRDLMQLSNIENREGLMIIFLHLARSIGSHLEVSNFSRESGLSYPATKKYLNVLDQAQLTFRLPGFQYGPAKRYIKAVKVYFSDNGIMNSLRTSLNDGQILENFVIAEFEKRRKLGIIKTDQLFYYKSVAGREIDLIFELEDRLVAVEIKNTQNPSDRDIRNLVEFREKTMKRVDCYLFYTGLQYHKINDVKLFPVASLFRGR